MGREDRIYQEACALWRELFREPPPAKADGQALLDLILRRMPERAHERLKSPHLRPATITMPRRA
jgi:hypothetical protein